MKAAGIYHETSAYIGFIGFRVSKGDVFEYGDEFPVGFREGISVKIPDPNPAMCGGLFPVHPSTEIPANKDIGHNFEMRISVPNPGEVFFKPDRKVDFLPDLPKAGLLGGFIRPDLAPGKFPQPSQQTVVFSPENQDSPLVKNHTDGDRIQGNLGTFETFRVCAHLPPCQRLAKGLQRT